MGNRSEWMLTYTRPAFSSLSSISPTGQTPTLGEPRKNVWNRGDSDQTSKVGDSGHMVTLMSEVGPAPDLMFEASQSWMMA